MADGPSGLQLCPATNVGSELESKKPRMETRINMRNLSQNW